MMPRFHLQKKEREIKDIQGILSLIKKGKYTSIAMCRNNEPYIVTLSYGYDEVKNALYFHSRLKGLKYEIIKENPQVCATIIEDKGYIMNECAHAFCSVGKDVFRGNVRGKEAWYGHPLKTSGGKSRQNKTRISFK